MRLLRKRVLLKRSVFSVKMKRDMDFCPGSANALPSRESNPSQRSTPAMSRFISMGTLEPRTGDGFFLEFSHLTADCFQLFMDQFSQAFPESLNVLVVDNGRFHRAKALEIPENVVLLFLPPYSPELNPIERFWTLSQGEGVYSNLQDFGRDASESH